MLRNTPTCVGKTSFFSHRMRTHWKHPHVRGEDAFFLMPRIEKIETPPRAWGRQTITYYVSCSDRNTPTCVGKTIQGLGVFIGDPETPPRAWGRPRKSEKISFVDRNTPTCVGKTSTISRPARQLWKHPHVRGEDEASSVKISSTLETPPRAWGRPFPP